MEGSFIESFNLYMGFFLSVVTWNLALVVPVTTLVWAMSAGPGVELR